MGAVTIKNDLSQFRHKKTECGTAPTPFLIAGSDFDLVAVSADDRVVLGGKTLLQVDPFVKGSKRYDECVGVRVRVAANGSHTDDPANVLQGADGDAFTGGAGVAVLSTEQDSAIHVSGMEELAVSVNGKPHDNRVGAKEIGGGLSHGCAQFVAVIAVFEGEFDLINRFLGGGGQGKDKAGEKKGNQSLFHNIRSVCSVFSW